MCQVILHYDSKVQLGENFPQKICKTEKNLLQSTSTSQVADIFIYWNKCNISSLKKQENAQLKA